MKKYCSMCNREVEATEKGTRETYNVKGDLIKIDAKVYYCDMCGTDIWDDCADDANLKNAFAEYRKTHNLLSPEQIKGIRNKYELSQSSFAKILGLGQKTITRYENGSIQDAAQNNLLRLMANSSSFEILWKQNKMLLTQSEIDKVETALCAIKSKKTICVDFAKLSVNGLSDSGVNFLLEM